MKILFVHQNAPAQYKHVIQHLASVPGNEVVVLTQPNQRPLPDRARKVEYTPEPSPGSGPGHRYLRHTEPAIRNGEAVMKAALELKAQGFRPDMMVGHNAWGETLFLKDVWPDAPLLSYFEFYYQARGADTGFDPEFPAGFDDFPRIRMMNTVNLLGLEAADWGHAPTLWQQSRFPERHRSRISIIHEGVDTAVLRPNPRIQLSLPDGRTVRQGDEIITYVSRSLEPYRGFHIFMRALPEILRRRPKAQIIVVGGDDVSYGARLSDGRTYREAMVAELGRGVDLSRVHFLGRVPYAHFLAVLQASAVHVYLTYPFVLSWSMLEAMSVGCLVLGSATPPVMEVIRDGENGLLVDFFNTKAIADRVDEALDHPTRMAELRQRARLSVIERYDVRSVCLPQFLGLLGDLANQRLPSAPIGPSAATPGPAIVPATIPSVPSPPPIGSYTSADVLAMARQADQRGDVAAAERLYRELVAQRPQMHEAAYELGILLYKNKRGGEGIPFLEMAVRAAPERAYYHADLGVLYKSLDRLEARHACYRRALALEPSHYAMLMNLGAALHDLGDARGAERACQRSLRLVPDHYGALTNLANAQVKLGHLDDAITTYRRALTAHPGHVELRKNLGICLLLKGEMIEGEEFYESRLQSTDMIRREFPVPRWDGERFAGKILLLHAEQGLGDTLNFCRYAPMVKALGGRVLLEAQSPLVSALQGLEGVDEVVTYSRPLPHFDLYCPLMSLMKVFRTEVASIPAQVPYLRSDPTRRDHWRNRLPDRGRLKVGLVWAGSPTHQNDLHRSVSLDRLRPHIEATEGVDFYSLQVGPARAQIAASGLVSHISDLGEEFRDFADTAAVVDQLDLVISVDTSVVHLTGALNRPVWVMITYAPDWRWLLDRDDSPWYPSMRLFRQGPDESWDGVLDTVFADLRLKVRDASRAAR
jgi:glycosyltransferase involved in cell wall biosynthesis/tetratricopeptide (TPR) repeat protein